MIRWWQNLSVSRKLYGVVGIMALLIATELGTLFFAMTTLSAVRAFVGGEGVWSKAEKTAVFHLQKYALNHDERDFVLYEKQLAIPVGDHLGRLELEKINFDRDAAYKYFINGQIDPSDIDPMIHLIRRFYWVPQLERALARWRDGDAAMSELIAKAAVLQTEVHAARRATTHLDRKLANARTGSAVNEIFTLDDRLTMLETQFSARLGDASRWLERLLRNALLTTVLTIEATGLLLTISFARSLARVLTGLKEAFGRVGRGDFSIRVPIQSKDELGQISASLNLMAENLERASADRASAEHASETKNIFLANMSHEIRTPLNAILGFSEILAEPSLSEAERARYAAIVKRTGTSLLSIISDILDVAKVEADKVEIENREFSLSTLLSDLSSVLSLRAEEKGINLIIEKNPEVRDQLVSDPARLRQILSNMIGNSIKFTDRGSVTVRYHVEGDKLVFIVEDSGVGIATENIAKLFQPFAQGDASVRKKYGGTGLGLLISQRLARLVGGDVVLSESRSGHGSKFRVTIDYHPSKTNSDAIVRPHQPPAGASFAGKKILVVEDSPDNQLLAQLYLSRTGATVEFADNGQDGLRKGLATPFDAILMDMQMPIMDGYTATTALRDQGVRTPIIALTGYAMKDDQERCLRAGCDAYLTKPIDRVSLFAKLSEWIEGPTV